MTLDRIIEKLRHWRRPWLGGSEPLEIHRAVLEAIEAEAVAVGGGRHVFPYDRVEVKLLAATPGESARLDAVAQEGWDLAREVRQRLAARGVRFPETLAVAVQVTEERGPEFGDRRYAVVCRKPAAPAPPGESGGDASADDGRPGTPGPPVPTASATPPLQTADGAASPLGSMPASGPGGRPTSGSLPRPAAGSRPLLRLTVVKGQAARPSYDLAAERIFLGRLEEVLDAAGRVMRRNDVAFLEEGELSHTVSREHARIAWDAATQSYWLRDEGSAAGTVIFRTGRSIEVSRHDRRGVRLETGDEVYLGRAALKAEIAPRQVAPKADPVAAAPPAAAAPQQKMEPPDTLAKAEPAGPDAERSAAANVADPAATIGVHPLPAPAPDGEGI
jgi:hypothetical protein